MIVDCNSRSGFHERLRIKSFNIDTHVSCLTILMECRTCFYTFPLEDYLMSLTQAIQNKFDRLTFTHILDNTARLDGPQNKP